MNFIVTGNQEGKIKKEYKHAVMQLELQGSWWPVLTTLSLFG